MSNRILVLATFLALSNLVSGQEDPVQFDGAPIQGGNRIPVWSYLGPISFKDNIDQVQNKRNASSTISISTETRRLLTEPFWSFLTEVRPNLNGQRKNPTFSLPWSYSEKTSDPNDFSVQRNFSPWFPDNTSFKDFLDRNHQVKRNVTEDSNELSFEGFSDDDLPWILGARKDNQTNAFERPSWDFVQRISSFLNGLLGTPTTFSDNSDPESNTEEQMLTIRNGTGIISFLKNQSSRDTSIIDQELLEKCPSKSCDLSSFRPSFLQIIQELLSVPWKVSELFKVILQNIFDHFITRGGSVANFDTTTLFKKFARRQDMNLNLNLPNIQLLPLLKSGTKLFAWATMLRKLFGLRLGVVLKMMGIDIPLKDIAKLEKVTQLIIDVLLRIVKILVFLLQGKPLVVIIEEMAPIFDIFGIKTGLRDLLRWLKGDFKLKLERLLRHPTLEELLEIITEVLPGIVWPLKWKLIWPVIIVWIKWLYVRTSKVLNIQAWFVWIFNIIYPSPLQTTSFTSPLTEPTGKPLYQFPIITTEYWNASYRPTKITSRPTKTNEVYWPTPPTKPDWKSTPTIWPHSTIATKKRWPTRPTIPHRRSTALTVRPPALITTTQTTESPQTTKPSSLRPTTPHQKSITTSTVRPHALITTTKKPWPRPPVWPPMASSTTQTTESPQTSKPSSSRPTTPHQESITTSPVWPPTLGTTTKKPRSRPNVWPPTASSTTRTTESPQTTKPKPSRSTTPHQRSITTSPVWPPALNTTTRKPWPRPPVWPPMASSTTQTTESPQTTKPWPSRPSTPHQESITTSRIWPPALNTTTKKPWPTKHRPTPSSRPLKTTKSAITNRPTRYLSTRPPNHVTTKTPYLASTTTFQYPRPTPPLVIPKPCLKLWCCVGVSWFLCPLKIFIKILKIFSLGKVSILVKKAMWEFVRLLLPGRLVPEVPFITIAKKILSLGWYNPFGLLRLLLKKPLKIFGFSNAEQIIGWLTQTIPWMPTAIWNLLIPWYFRFVNQKQTPSTEVVIEPPVIIQPPPLIDGHRKPYYVVRPPWGDTDQFQSIRFSQDSQEATDYSEETDNIDEDYSERGVDEEDIDYFEETNGDDAPEKSSEPMIDKKDTVLKQWFLRGGSVEIGKSNCT